MRDKFLVPPKAVSVPLKFQREGIRYEDLSEDEKDQWDALEWDEEGDVPDAVGAERFLTIEEIGRLADTLRDVEQHGLNWKLTPDLDASRAKHRAKAEHQQIEVSPFVIAAIRLLLYWLPSKRNLEPEMVGSRF